MIWQRYAAVLLMAGILALLIVYGSILFLVVMNAGLLYLLFLRGRAEFAAGWKMYYAVAGFLAAPLLFSLQGPFYGVLPITIYGCCIWVLVAIGRLLHRVRANTCTNI